MENDILSYKKQTVPLTLFFGAAMGSEKAKNGRARLQNPFL